jgi:hypothetical protein
MSLFRFHSGHREVDVDDLEVRLADLRDAMYWASRARHDPAAQRVFLEALFADGGTSLSCFTTVVEARDVPS